MSGVKGFTARREDRADRAPIETFPFAHRLSLEFRLSTEGVRVTYTVRNHGSEEVPFGFGLENQTCSTDAHNLNDRGFVVESGLQTVAPGASHQGSVTYAVSFD